MRNWKTTVCGVAVIVGAIANTTVSVLDPGSTRQPLSVPELIALIATGVGLIVAKDGKEKEGE